PRLRRRRTLLCPVEGRQSTAVRRRRKGQRPGACALQYFVCPQQGRAKYACAGAVAEDQKRTSCNEDGRHRSGPETPIRPDQQRDRPWIEYLQQANRDLENRAQELLETRQNVTSEVVNLSTKNEELCQELLEIDQMAQQLERDKERVLVTADAEIEEAKSEIKRLHIEITKLESILSQYKSDLSNCEFEKNKLADEFETRKDENRKLESLLNHAENEKQRLSSKLETQMVTERELVLEIERMRTQHGILRSDRSPSRLDSFVKSLEEERNHYRIEMEKLERALNLKSSTRNISIQETSRTPNSPEK
ncbi:unnamed protein product, partial [Ranitomeya imitator]